jgi:hypothetical protein
MRPKPRSQLPHRNIRIITPRSAYLLKQLHTRPLCHEPTVHHKKQHHQHPALGGAKIRYHNPIKWGQNRRSHSPTTRLGDWYANRVYIRPKQHIIFVNETTLLPVVIPAAPSKTIETRFVHQLGIVLRALGIDEPSIAVETASMNQNVWTKTSNRSVVGSMTDFIKHIEYRQTIVGQLTLTELAMELARTPCRAGRSFSIWPDEETRNAFSPTKTT